MHSEQWVTYVTPRPAFFQENVIVYIVAPYKVATKSHCLSCSYGVTHPYTVI